MSLKQWFGYGFLAGLLYAVVRNPAGCLVWMAVLTIVAALMLFAIIDALSPALLVVIIIGVAGAAAFGAAYGASIRQRPPDEP